MSDRPTTSSDDRALEAALARVPVPSVPVGLAARIIRDVPRLPQLPRDQADEAPLTVSNHLGPKIIALATRSNDDPVPDRAEAQSIAPVGATPQAKRGPAWFALTASGFGAMAAGLAAVVALGLSMGEAGPVSRDDPAAVTVAAAPNPVADTSKAAGTARAPAQLAIASAPAQRRLARAANSAAVPPASAVSAPIVAPAAVAAAPGAPGPEQLAIGPVQGAPDDRGTAAALTPLGSRGVMGPVLPQGYGYAGSGGLPEIPGNAPVRMSGGPGPAPGAGPGPGPGGPH